eukprot:c18560_g1_i2.p1 GENE.c18560_g1_i2~~c18560_g1_i2.p1  ORF type:complete len:290 (-),score=106.34 c18560_g1_i2:41-910(-)
MGGKIKCESVLGQGSQFSFYVPVKFLASKLIHNNPNSTLHPYSIDNHSNSFRHSSKSLSFGVLDEGAENSATSFLSSPNSIRIHVLPHEHETNLKALHILVADDSSINRNILERLLRKNNHQVESVSNGLDALNLYKTKGQTFDLILMDLMMPVMKGDEAAKLIRDHEATNSQKTIPIFAVSGDTSEKTRKLCLESGINALLNKPIQLNEIYQALQNYTQSQSQTQPQTQHQTQTQVQPQSLSKENLNDKSNSNCNNNDDNLSSNSVIGVVSVPPNNTNPNTTSETIEV